MSIICHWRKTVCICSYWTVPHFEEKRYYISGGEDTSLGFGSSPFGLLRPACRALTNGGFSSVLAMYVDPDCMGTMSISKLSLNITFGQPSTAAVCWKNEDCMINVALRL
jgi:hypothetical protein